MSSWPASLRLGVVVERAGGLQLAHRVGAGLHASRSCRPRAASPCRRRPSPRPRRSRPRRSAPEASAAEYCALMTSFLVRNWPRSWAKLLLRSRSSVCCWASSSGTWVSRPCSSAWANCLRSSATRARSSRFCDKRLARLRVQLDDLTARASAAGSCRRFLAVTTSAMPFLTFCSELQLLLVAVLQRLSRVLGRGRGASADLAFDDRGETAAYRPANRASVQIVCGQRSDQAAVGP